MTSLFSEIAKVIPTLDGWCSQEKGAALAAMILSIRPAVTVEIGVFGGSSFIPMAMAHRFCGCGKVTGIDPWKAEESALGQTGENLEWWSKKINHAEVFRRFNSHLDELGLRPWVNILAMPSNAVTPPKVIDVLHIDGNHGPQAVVDVQRFSPHLRVGGFCIMDDLTWPEGHVQKAADLLLKMGFIHLYPLGTGAAYQKVK